MSRRYFSLALLPNLVTLMNLFSGFLAVMMMFTEKYEIAAGLIALALLCDSLDGKISRIFKNSTEFGKELDSLADIVSFILAPAVMATRILFLKMSPWMLLVIFVYLGAGAYRLARYNVKSSGGKHFEGLPSPAAGLMLSMFSLSCHQNGWIDLNFSPIVSTCLIAALSYLMASTVIYPKFSNVKLSHWYIFIIIGAAIFVFAWMTATPAAALTGAALFYILFSPMQHSFLLRHNLIPGPEAQSDGV